MASPEAQTFSVRLWPENLGSGQHEWRGQVRHLPSGETRYIRDWSALVAFLQEMLPRIEDTPEPKDKRH